MNLKQEQGRNPKEPEVHIYTTGFQPATNYRDASNPDHRPIRFRNGRRKLIQCSVCYRMRQARNLVVQVYYDMHRFVCKNGKGCKFDK
jgi:hypothetical protein